MDIHGQVGPQRLSDGTSQTFRQSKTGGMVVVPGHARYWEQTSRGNVYSAANQAAVTSPAGLATASTVFTLYNPAGSGVMLSIIDVGVAIAAAPAAASVIYLVVNNNPIQTAPATVTALTVNNNYLNTTSGQGKVYSTATLAATPQVARVLGSVPAASNNTAAYIKDEISGALILQPGTYISIQATTAISLIAHMTWEEISIT